MGVFDLGDLRQRHRDPVARGDGEIADMAEIEPLGRHRARDHVDLLDAVAHRGHRRARDQHAQRLRYVLRGEAERAGAILVDHQLQVRRLFVPVELRVLDLVVLPDHVAHPVGDVAHDPGIRPDHAELDREADRRTEVEAIDPHAGFGQCAVVDRLLQPRLDPLARLDILGDDDDFGKGFIRQLRVEPEPEPRRTLPDIGGIGRNIAVVLQQLSRPS